LKKNFTLMALGLFALAATPVAAYAEDGVAPQFSSGQVSAGQNAYATNCASCHGGSLEGTNDAPALSGDFFGSYWTGKPVADLYTHLSEFMPPSAPGSLPEDTYLNITAYILSIYGHAPGDKALAIGDEMSTMTLGVGL
jgi:mono/diheme cytochrome c family protein